MEIRMFSEKGGWTTVHNTVQRDYHLKLGWRVVEPPVPHETSVVVEEEVKRKPGRPPKGK